ncbi:MAG: DUF2721 domain-containing protein [Bacteroidales bacterium]|jgi:polyferredoxin|nr:DUF2721 domain-containing protein [Bacteroidales bacterium]
MESTTLFIEFLKSCITPVALISGVGLMLLTITNRFGRTIDRTRSLVAELDHEQVNRREAKKNEIKILYMRSKYLRTSIAAITFSVIASSLIIPLLAFMQFFAYDLRLVGYFLFSVSVLAILIAAVFFFLDVLLSLKALRLEALEYIQ